MKRKCYTQEATKPTEITYGIPAKSKKELSKQKNINDGLRRGAVNGLIRFCEEVRKSN